MNQYDSFFYDWFGLNKALFLWVNKIHAPVLDQVMLAASWLGHPGLFPYYMAAALLLAWKKPELMPVRNVVVFSLCYIVTSMVMVPALKVALDFPRPWAVLEGQGITLLGNSDANHSFPSGHAAYIVLMAASLMSKLPRAGKNAMLVWVWLVCISRVSVGAHFPADVVAGVAIAMLNVWAARKWLPD
ncbi:undecaprenyl-diphosphatase [Formivibrio citricus]|uniref:Undecaprenyl-diphosphatase n=1 Tax=Formivibrio citricus TaxID=83765 RepID=A0A1I4WY73_9NEIS|nr:phosphatase PAP2 family protein [Formivibrio citricus]SFN18342.1 undecaprenyl-diphosphatase [Formivibrio citricus]